jgi:hypothetical protein
MNNGRPQGTLKFSDSLLKFLGFKSNGLKHKLSGGRRREEEREGEKREGREEEREPRKREINYLAKRF